MFDERKTMRLLRRADVRALRRMRQPPEPLRGVYVRMSPLPSSPPDMARVRAARAFIDATQGYDGPRQKRNELLAFLVTVEGMEAGAAAEMAWRAHPEVTR